MGGSTTGSSVGSASGGGSSGEGGSNVQVERKGISMMVAAVFIVAQMAGAGFVSLPAALANTGWLGLPMMLMFCPIVAYTATCLGISYNILEERWPEEYSTPCRQPYMELSLRALGKTGKNLTLACVLINQYGSTTVFMLLASQMINKMVPALSVCEWVLIIAAILMPIGWLGTPKDFWAGPLIACCTTVICVLVVVVEVIMEASSVDYQVYYRNPTISTFPLGFGAILFAFGGSSVFPTVQNDMKDRSQFWKSVIIGFCIILSMYVPLAVSSYTIFGWGVDSNILMQLSGKVVDAAMCLQIINLLGSYGIGFNVVAQSVEDIMGIPHFFTWKRVVTRTSLILSQILIGLAVPDFSLLLNLIGGSVVTACTFIFPPLIYLRLCSSGTEKQRREIPLWSKVFLIEAIIIGTLGGISSTIMAFIQILNQPLGDSCLVNFAQSATTES